MNGIITLTRWLSKLGREALAGGGGGGAAGGGSGGGVALVGDAAGVLHLFHLPARASGGIDATCTVSRSYGIVK